MDAPADPDPDAYLDLLERCLTASIYPESAWQLVTGFRAGSGGLLSRVRRAIVRAASQRNLVIMRRRPFDLAARERGLDAPSFGYTMIGLQRLRQIRCAVQDVLERNVPGDLLEAGVWRGGAAMMMRAVLKRHGVTDRIVWAADSFEGLPAPTEQVDKQAGAQFDLAGYDYLAVGL